MGEENSTRKVPRFFPKLGSEEELVSVLREEHPQEIENAKYFRCLIDDDRTEVEVHNDESERIDGLSEKVEEKLGEYRPDGQYEIFIKTVYL